MQKRKSFCLPYDTFGGSTLKNRRILLCLFKSALGIPKESPRGAQGFKMKLWEGFGRLWEGVGEALGRLWEALGRLWEASGQGF